ncbi:hypothetical protein HBH82_187140 [Parastagonospora nodorum]|nr:hypothetical protein HBH82_187140 [Parastagonospora nodorum]KAH4672156.1 hypothetical protein HBH78_175480 [Parastagonospora nodorum]KAH4696893.1 hypothetical protein HBH67_188740 [Parastagonospora nodorum]KAH4764232.1 hypothetical protein HBH63_186200 [Parastagonospora nodorum]KAH4773831.1 hypothetical protein HBH62_190510 [Parastagonospora nodorum]
MASTTESVTYGELVQYANEHFSQEFKSLPLLSTIKIQKFGGKESDRDYAGPPRAENYRVCIARTKKDVLGKQPVRIIITTTSDKIAEYDPWYSQYITALSRPSEYELYDPFHHVSGSEEQSCKLRMIVLSLYYVMRSGLATSCVLDRESSKIGLLETFKEVCSLVFAAKAASKTVLEQPQNDRQYVIRLRLCPDLLMQFQDGEMSPNGGVPQPAPSIHDSIAVIPAKRTLMGLRPRNSRASDRGVPTAKRIKVTAHPPAHQTETGYAIINSMHEIVQKGEIAEAALTEAKEAIATLIAQQDALKTENNKFKTENEQLINEKRASEVEAAESMRSHNQLVAEYDTALSNEKRASEVAAAESMRSHNQLVAEYDTVQITIRDLDARITAMTSERANVSQELTKSTTENGRLMTEIATLKQQVNTIAAEKDSHFKEQITALERDKNMLNTQNADLKEDRDKLKKGFRDAVSELEAYKKRVLALGNE